MFFTKSLWLFTNKIRLQFLSLGTVMVEVRLELSFVTYVDGPVRT